ncbi:MAG: Rpn family recombination-promoting nuclease/putative transposase [Prevotellaceae bacterium]|nr:Rpn family recombination-promoting nuclease/putative transposase [Prevotellaceae bacterium]
MSNISETYQTEGRYLNPLTDYGFKKVFGEKDIMIAFLTDLLNPKSPIEDIVFIDKDIVADSEEIRGVIYDLRCKTKDGGEFIVEMQNKGQLNFSDRILFYLSRSFSSQERKGNSTWDYELNPVYGVFFMNFHMKGLKPQAIRTIQLKVDETGEVFSEKLKAFTLELPDYKGKSTEYPKSPIEYWLYNLVNMETMTTALPFQAQQPIFGKVGGISELVHMSEEERMKYNVSLDTYRTNLSVMKNERAEGHAEGKAEGIVEGRADRDKEIVMRLLSKGMESAEIADMIGLDINKVNQIIATL